MPYLIDLLPPPNLPQAKLSAVKESWAFGGFLDEKEAISTKYHKLFFHIEVGEHSFLSFRLILIM